MVEVRRARLDDHRFIVSFQQKMAQETEGHFLVEKVISEGVNTILRDPSKGYYYVACVDNTPIASLMITYEWSDWRNGNIWWIQSVYVDAQFRGKGVYRKMYEYIKAEVSTDKSIAGIRLYVYNENTRAQEVYKKLGMTGGNYQVFEWMKD